MKIVTIFNVYTNAAPLLSISASLSKVYTITHES